MAKRLNISEDSDDSDKDVFSIKRPKLAAEAAQSSGSGSSSDPDSDAEWTMDDKGSGKKVTASAKKGGQKVGGGGGGAGASGGGGKGRKGARKVSSKKMASLPSSSDSSDEEDEDDREMRDDGDLSSSSGESSSDSDSDSSRNSVKFDDGLDDQLMGDEDDQKTLGNMNEKEREAEMYNRYERREALKARFEIEQRLIRQKKSMKKKKYKQDKMKRSLRDKRPQKQDNKSAKSQAMDEYKAKRVADKIRKAEAEKQPEEKEPLKVSDVFSSESDSDDASSSSSAEFEESKSSKPISTASELGRIKLSRYRLEKWVHMPYFKDAVVGCFVRIGIGAHDGRMVYRICEVTNVQETQKVYNLGSTKTNKGLKLRHGIQERIFRMEYVSNSPFVELEFNKWVVEMEKRGLQLPTVDSVQKKVKDLEKFRNTSLKEEDVEKIVKEKQRFRKNPRNYAMTKSRLIRERDLAEQDGETEKVKGLADKLLELEERADQLDKQRTKGLSAISYINERNRQKNVVRAELALKEELAATEGKEDDPFTRRKCQPTLVTLTREGAEAVHVSPNKSTPSKKPDIQADGSDMQTPSGPRNGEELEATPSASTLFATPIPPPAMPQVNDLFSAHNFDIQIDLPSSDDGNSVTPKAIARPTATPKQDGPKRSLNLADYKKRRGLI